jgi:hypothetical protein
MHGGRDTVSMPFHSRATECELTNSAGGLSMNGLLRKLPMIVLLGSLLYSTPGLTQVSPTTEKAAKVRITQGPEIERNDFVVIVRWTSNNPGGSPEHFGVVHYGTSPKELSQTAKSPIRLNPSHSSTVFRVRMDDLNPRTTYYYTVGAMESNGKDDGLKSEVKQFTTN